ncbi:hypothetical protein Baya_4423 [Bagarius yarrelli]|uniref:Uncharacterized protein n=1 Tax=Bagarius yarrelli TaxID=175774 RepID=A0A556TQ59_BAGYA|nr:hypothetical protein Baya_4423 [Bagarius yarrelli]
METWRKGKKDGDVEKGQERWRRREKEIEWLPETDDLMSKIRCSIAEIVNTEAPLISPLNFAACQALPVSTRCSLFPPYYSYFLTHNRRHSGLDFLQFPYERQNQFLTPSRLAQSRQLQRWRRCGFPTCLRRFPSRGLIKRFAEAYEV